MTTIRLIIFADTWDEAASHLKRLGLALTRENTVKVKHTRIKIILGELWNLTAARVIAGFSVTYDEIYAAEEQEQETAQ